RRMACMTNTYDFVRTPFGDALPDFSNAGVVRFDHSEADDPTVPWLLEKVTLSLGAMPVPDPGAADELAHLVDRYFEGEIIDFRDHVSFDCQLAPGFAGDALRAIAGIAYGGTLSYGEVAVAAGSERVA